MNKYIFTCRCIGQITPTCSYRCTNIILRFSTHKSGGVVVSDGLGITIGLKNWIGFNNLVFKSTFLILKLEIKHMLCHLLFYLFCILLSLFYNTCSNNER